MAYLITPTLYSDYLWYISSEQDKSEFLSRLRKEPQETTDAMRRGIEFESNVWAACNGVNNEDPVVMEAAQILKGSLYQQKFSKQIDDFVLYCRADFVRGNTIFDTKRISSYDIGKYADSLQHGISLVCMPTAERFQYVISDGNNLYTEDYYRSPTTGQEVMAKVRDMYNWFKQDPEIWEAFHNNWQSRY